MYDFDARAEGIEVFVVAVGPRQGAMAVDSTWDSIGKAKARFEMLRAPCKAWFYVGPANDYMAREVVQFGIKAGSPVDGYAPEMWGCSVAASVTPCSACGSFPLIEGDDRPCDDCLYAECDDD